MPNQIIIVGRIDTIEIATYSLLSPSPNKIVSLIKENIPKAIKYGLKNIPKNIKRNPNAKLPLTDKKFNKWLPINFSLVPK